MNDAWISLLSGVVVPARPGQSRAHLSSFHPTSPGVGLHLLGGTSELRVASLRLPVTTIRTEEPASSVPAGTSLLQRGSWPRLASKPYCPDFGACSYALLKRRRHSYEATMEAMY